MSSKPAPSPDSHSPSRFQRRHRGWRAAVFASLIAGLASGARSQCSTAWSSAAPDVSLAGNGRCSTQWDPDGSGPQPRRLVIGGDALVGGTSPSANRVMAFDGTRWEVLGPGPGTTGAVFQLLVWNGLLIAAGNFTGGGTDRIAAWNGTAWMPLGPGLSAAPSAIGEWNGNLVVSFSGSSSAMQSWNGVTWSTLPTPGFNVMAMVSYQGLLCVGGVTAVSSGALGRWNGTSWLPTLTANGAIRCFAVRTPLAVGAQPILYVGGGFTSIGPGGVTAICVASTTGGTTFAFSPVGSGLPYGGTGFMACRGLHARSVGLTGFQIVARAEFATAPVLTYSGSSFVPMGNQTLSSLEYYGGAYHGAAIGTSAAPDASWRYDGAAWNPVVGQGLDGEVRALEPSGADMIVAGTILTSGGVALNRIARWNGTTFQPLGTGMSGTSVDALVTDANGDLVAGGAFGAAGGVASNNIARWDGSVWSPLGFGCDLQVLALCRMPNGDLIAGGKFNTAGGVPCARIARWNGAAWLPLGLGMNGDVRALAVRSDGVLFAGGDFTIAGAASCSRIAQWNGSTWSPLGLGVNGSVHALAVRPNDDLVATGAFTTVVGVVTDRCARWNGSTWIGLGASSADPTVVGALCVLPDGDVVAGRGFHQAATNPDTGIARWGGFNWTGFGSGLAGATAGAPVTVRALARRADGALIVGGSFGVADGLVALGLAGLASTCPASVVSYGLGCPGTTGPLVMTQQSLPWTGSSFRTATTGMSPVSLCLLVTGFAQVSIPLPSLLPEGQAGCVLLSSPDIVDALLADAAGIARSTLALAASPSLVGATFSQQAIPLEFTGAGALAAVFGSNALSMTIGTF